MKTSKRILSILLVLAMLLSLGCAAFASGEASGGASGGGSGGMGNDKSGDAELQAMIADVAPLFSVDEYTDAETGLTVEYNLYLPEGYDAATSYPMVVFIPDASVVGRGAEAVLTQGWGALIWATEEEQAKHPSIVIAPAFPVTILDDHTEHVTTDYVDLTPRMVEALAEKYNADTDRIYVTGQSMGAMTFLYLAANNPDLFTAEMIVDGQWDVTTLSGLASQKFFYITAGGDVKASHGLTDVMEMFDRDGVPYSYSEGWDAQADADELYALVEMELAEGNDKNFIRWETGTVLNGGSGQEHMASFDYGYKLEAVRDWLFRQTKADTAGASSEPAASGGSSEASGTAAAAPAGSVSAQDAIVSVKSYGFVDLEGAKLSHIIVEYAEDILASSVSLDDYTVMDYAIFEEQASGFENAIEVDYDGVPGNEGQPVRVYVNDEPAPSEDGGAEAGKYVVIEVNTDYMLSGQNLIYYTSMMAGVTQVGEVSGKTMTVLPSDEEICNYTVEQYETTNNWGTRTVTEITTEKDNILLPEFGPGSGWTLNYIGGGAFPATHCYSEYTGEYEDFELPYSIYVPDKAIMDANKGNVAIVVHMEHAGSNDTDPMAAITSSKAAVKLSSDEVQSMGPAIIVVPQIEEDRRSTDDYDASSEANTAVWELLDYLLDEYSDYIDTNRIYGTGQSMGGMTILNMAAQRDNFFAGIAVVGAQWSTNYSKEFQHNNSPMRTPENDPISFNGFGLDAENYQNWYYMVSDDNIMVHTCAGDPMATGEWAYLAEYFALAGGSVAQDEWGPYISLEEQYQKDAALTAGDHTAPGTGIFWGRFNRGNHMSTWKYGYQLDYPFEWLFAQTRETEMARGKLEQLKNDWLGRDASGNILPGSGTTGLNAAQYTPGGANAAYPEGWTPVSATQALIDSLSEGSGEINQRTLSSAQSAYASLSDAEKAEIVGAEILTQAAG